MGEYSFKKKERLKGKTQIDALFTNGKALTVYPLRLIYLPTNFEDGSVFKTGVSVSKRLHKIAVTRNRIKRLLRETYRLNKPSDFNKKETGFALMILYLSKDEPTFDLLNSKMSILISKFKASIEQQL